MHEAAFCYQRDTPRVSGQFISIFADAFQQVADVDLLRDLVVHHHQDKIGEVTNNRVRNLAYLVNKADILSSKERGERAETKQDYKVTPLAPVFHRVFSTSSMPLLPRHHPFFLTEPCKLTDASIFPADFQAYAINELEETIKAFGDETKSVFENLGASFNLITSHALILLQTYPAR